MRKKLLLLVLGLLLLAPSYSLSEKKTVRVGISNQSFSNWDYQSVKLSSDSDIQITSMVENIKNSIELIEANKIIEIKIDNNLYNIYVDNELKYSNLKAPLLFSSNSDLQVIGLNRKGLPAKYRGMLEIVNSKNDMRFNLVNVVDMDSYLNGVVPNEMPISFGLEALKAQAVAARNYVTNANISKNYDVVDSTASQVYYGSNSYRDISSQAVKETSGIYAIYNEKPISALYFSTSPGITDDWDDVFGNGNKSNNYPYLKAKIDKGGQKFLETEEDVIEFYSSKNGLDTNSPKFRWSVEFTRKELEEIIHTTLQQQSKIGLVSPKYDGDNKIEGLQDIKITKRTKSGKALEMLIDAKNGEYLVKKESAIRRVLKKNNTMLPSSNFYVEKTGDDELNPELEDTGKGLLKLFNHLEDEKYPTNFRFIGGGFGHNVGMSQYGAYNLAKCGKKYPEILKYYYTGINISTMPRTVLYNEWNVHYKTDFYFDKKTYNSAYLIISNQKDATEFPFKINGFEFNDTKGIAVNKLLKINITQYLNQGLNIIDFNPLTLENRGKIVDYRIELL